MKFVSAPVATFALAFEPAKSTEISAMAAREDRVLRANAAASRFGVALRYARTLASGAELVKLDRSMSLPDATALAIAVERTAGVRYAVPNRIIRTQIVPNDPLFSDVGQWGFKYSPGSIEGANFVGAWDVTTGSAAQRIGIRTRRTPLLVAVTAPMCRERLLRRLRLAEAVWVARVALRLQKYSWHGASAHRLVRMQTRLMQCSG